MFGRKAKRIAELEGKLQDALENLVHVTVQFPKPAQVAFEAVRVRKGVWHQASVSFKVDDHGSTLTGMYLGEQPPVQEYFDGSNVEQWTDSWTGEAKD